jgi:hypothetical protein
MIKIKKALCNTLHPRTRAHVDVVKVTRENVIVRIVRVSS